MAKAGNESIILRNDKAQAFVVVDDDSFPFSFPDFAYRTKQNLQGHARRLQQ